MKFFYKHLLLRAETCCRSLQPQDTNPNLKNTTSSSWTRKVRKMDMDDREGRHGRQRWEIGVGDIETKKYGIQWVFDAFVFVLLLCCSLYDSSH